MCVFRQAITLVLLETCSVFSVIGKELFPVKNEVGVKSNLGSRMNAGWEWNSGEMLATLILGIR